MFGGWRPPESEVAFTKQQSSRATLNAAQQCEVP